MSSYTTVANIKTIVGIKELSAITPQTDPTTGEPLPGFPVDETRIEDIIVIQSAVVDSYLNSITSVPLTTVPGLIEEITRDFVVCNLYADESSVPVDVKEKCEWARLQLERIQSGELNAGLELTNSRVETYYPFSATERGGYTVPKFNMNLLEPDEGGQIGPPVK